MVDSTVSGSAIILEDTISGSSITLEDVNGSLSDMVSSFEEKFLYIQEQFNKRAEFFETIEEKIDYFFDMFESFGDVVIEHQGIIMGILIFALLWFALWLVYKLFRIFF